MSKDYLRREADLKRLDGYETGAKRQEVLADAVAAYGRALADCTARVERATR
jgi:hypothetical protein